jgi:hypothetical protein
MAYFSQLLALFLILLCFFIMLVAMSQPRLRPAGTAASETMAADHGRAPAADGAVALLADLRSRLAPHVGTVLAAGLGKGSVLNVVLPVHQLFERRSDRLAVSSIGLMEALAQSLAADADGRALELEAVFSAPGLTSQPMLAERAGALARELVRLGAPPRRVAVGVEEGAADRIRLSFYMRDIAVGDIPTIGARP